eukprot:TRINITY_DN5422_c1_g1_i1.p1 TRINITY_DN5422_c1_g1~~TRINITY_DN5422_c1_g1_i1.p1  ORF type:complete len:216 (+),score=28.19 TRINITY_DN5422_c1_g1_i1:93-740(+)
MTGFKILVTLSLLLLCSGDQITTGPIGPAKETILEPGYEGYVDRIKITAYPVMPHEKDEQVSISLDGVWFSCSIAWGRSHHSCNMDINEDMAVLMPASLINKGQSAITATVQFDQVDVPQTGNILLYLAGIAVIVFAFLLVYSVLSVCRRRQSNQPPTGIVISDAPAYGTSIPRVSGVVINADFYKEALEESADVAADSVEDEGTTNETEETALN